LKSLSIKILLAAVWFACLLSCGDKKLYNDWQVYRGGLESNCYSSLNQVNTNNVGQLKVAWTYHTGDSGVTIQCNPIVVDDVMYVTSPSLRVIALKAETGEEIWNFDPVTGPKNQGVNRGVTYWQDGNDKRIFFTATYYLYALNAETGKLIAGFGNNGKIDLREGLDRNADDIFLEVTSPGVVYDDLLIMGSRVSEGEGAAPGHVRAFNAKTGKVTWVFHTIPRPGEYGYDTWEKDAWKKIGGANAWSGFSMERDRGLVFFATGSCSPDFYGGDRKGQNLFANSVVALEAATGRRKWHYQIIHHDLWDYDLPAAPNLVTVMVNGKSTDAVAQITKTGNIFVLDRESGKPVFEVEERKVPVSDIEGEESWPTQPFPLKPVPFVRQKYTAEDVSNISPEAQAYVSEKLKNIRNEGVFTPSGEAGSLIFPGFRGGAEWNGGAYDPQSGIMYINANEIPNISALKKVQSKNGTAQTVEALYQLNCATCHGRDKAGQPPFPSLLNVHQRLSVQQIASRIKNGKGEMPAFPHLSAQQVSRLAGYLSEKSSYVKQVSNTVSAEGSTSGVKYGHSGYGQFLDEQGYPAVKPPWGTLNAVNLNTGELVWKLPLGEYPELTKKGIPVTGTQNFGGTIVTAGGLVFVGATKDEKFRAFDKKTGKLLWQTILPAGGYATPTTFQVNGKQFIVIAAGGGGKNNTKKGDAYIAFALP
jgi:quinoprotein glucose dehydrogenase